MAQLLDAWGSIRGEHRDLFLFQPWLSDPSLEVNQPECEAEH